AGIVARNSLRFQGQQEDEETGLHYNRHRYYDPVSGRFVSKDPIGLAGGINFFQYAENPTGWIDPLGLARCPTSRAARREAMRQAGIPTSQQPISQSRNASGLEYRYEVPQAGGGKIQATVQQQTMDVSHQDDPHWEAGKVKIDPISGETRMNDYGRPKIANPKGKAYYGDCP
ncbi:RHS repeat-associated core domain-containing protein, partial [Burkholderia multivorans]